MKNALLFGLLFLMMESLTGCGKAQQIDPVFQGYYNEFLQKMQVRKVAGNTNVSIQFGTPSMDNGNLEGDVMGECDGSASVVIDTYYWKKLDDGERRLLVYHELGHCILGLNHDKSVKTLSFWEGNNLTTLLPASIMFPEPEVVTEQGYQVNQEYYDNQLFSSTSK